MVNPAGKKLCWFSIAVYVLLSSNWVGVAFAQEFRATGTVRMESLTLGKVFTQHFEIAVSGCRALILSSNIDASSGYVSINPRGGFVPHTNETDRLSVEVGIENGSIYNLARFYSEDGCRIAASIDAFRAPMDDVASQVNYLWFAFVSSSYFRQQTNNLLEPIWTLDDYQLREQHFKVLAGWSLNEVAPFLPKRVTYYSDGNLRGRVNGTSYVGLAPSPYDHGFTNFIYEELSATNSGGLEIPKEFRFTRYGFVRDSLTPIVIVSGRVDQFTPNASATVFTPPYTGGIEIADKRFALSNPPVDMVLFPASNGNWKGTNVERLYQRELKFNLLGKPQAVSGSVRAH
ncbi:MAG TPA: hypothetical protein VMR33_15510 [Candidatus Baltobacteraceae bacterium]|jgi:hypothetical protein|nr:hypothetical protein [Candidatus Baltobacteraceae bacterium]